MNIMKMQRLFLFLVALTSSVLLVDVAALCEDTTDKFPVVVGVNTEMKGCPWVQGKAGWRCKKDGVAAMCPETCDQCDATPTSSPTAATTVIPGEVLCEDKVGRFSIDSVSWITGRKKCGWALVNLWRCSINEVKINCPLTCDSCVCSDSTNSFTISTGKRKNCKWVQNMRTSQRCANFPQALYNCPLTCGACSLPTSTPSSAPSKKLVSTAMIQSSITVELVTVIPTDHFLVTYEEIIRSSYEENYVPSGTTVSSVDVNYLENDASRQSNIFRAAPVAAPANAIFTTEAEVPCTTDSCDETLVAYAAESTTLAELASTPGLGLGEKATAFAESLGATLDLETSGEFSFVVTNEIVNAATPRPTSSPTKSPTKNPTASPTENPTTSPTNNPTATATKSPTENPSTSPSKSPTRSPVTGPTKSPTKSPTATPTKSPSPSSQPSPQPSDKPSPQPSRKPSPQPSSTPSVSPSSQPSPQPSDKPSPQPSRKPSPQPSSTPSVSAKPSVTNSPSAAPTPTPTCQASDSLGKTFILFSSTLDACIKWELSIFVGKFYVNLNHGATNPCDATTTFGSDFSAFSGISEDIAIYSAGTQGWSGELSIRSSQSISDVVLDSFTVNDPSANQWRATIVLPSCTFTQT